ncbi:enoyl-CoA hydratase/isomerase family protein [Labrys wisconsinensis]|uniref:3-hydroxyisobutyryl-CoA hydrolase n=1 Tax=Labrys wisconsinensis TaxID=425677 RepID=A0ABU0J4T9_9HYPH|nr:enoyl-CoA hydratase/isomerase family protein [Labrys wisconsinensis]MDQ0469249.1 enoyl-CoA hydratase [Labrys wisconsinensis]
MSGVEVRIDGRAGRLTLARPAALNALTLAMVRQIDAALADWQDDEAVAVVVIDAAPGPAFSAGGDIRAIRDAVRAGDVATCAAFFGEEYALDDRLARYPKPVVALMDGTTMGGGVGIGCHGTRRVVTERAVLALPEVHIGFHPDIGAAWLLANAPGELGTHLALTGSRFGPDDAIACGFADRRIASGRLGEVIRGLSACGSAAEVDAVLAAAAEGPGEGALAPARAWIDRCYAGDSVEEILAALRAAPEAGAAPAAKAIAAASPGSLKLTLAALRRRPASLEACLDRDFRLTLSRIFDPDFAEGVRAVLVDKDRNPAWSPARLEDVSAAEVERHFAGPDLGLS